MAVDQLMADYQEKGYDVDKERQIGEYKADLVATKGEEVIVIEVKARNMDSRMQKKLAEIGNYVRNRKNHRFLVVIATPPKRKKINIPKLAQLLEAYLKENIPEDLYDLATSPLVDEVTDVVVDELTINSDGNMVGKGTGVIDVTLQRGPANDGVSIEDVFSFEFTVVLDRNQHHELTIVETEVRIDTTSYDE